jgi:hypothetical protein
MITRDENKEINLAKEKEKTRAELYTTKKMIKQMSGTLLEEDFESLDHIRIQDSNKALPLLQRLMTNAVEKKHIELIVDLPEGFDDQSLNAKNKWMRELEQKNLQLT